MSEIEKLYYDNRDSLIDNYADTEKTKKAYADMEKAIGDEAVCDEIMDYATESERQGFIFGFRYAAALLTNGKEVRNDSTQPYPYT